MKIKLSLDDYKTEPLKLSIDGVDGEMVIRSLASREWKVAQSKYLAALDYARENEIALKVDESVGFEHDGKDVTQKVDSEFVVKNYANAMASLVADWPFDAPLIDCLLENKDLASAIDITASRLQAEFVDKKKI